MIKPIKLLFIINFTALFIIGCGNKKDLYYPQIETTDVIISSTNTLKKHR